MQPHTFERIGPMAFRCESCGRISRVEGEDVAPERCDGCLELERMETVRVEPFTAAELEPPETDG